MSTIPTYPQADSSLTVDDYVGRRPDDSPRAVTPMAVRERIGALDVMRGFALLGILLVNVEIFRGADLYRSLAGAEPTRSAADTATQFVVGWLAGGKFISSFAILFGIGAAIMVRRAQALGASPGRLLARRYAWLAVFGIGHMLVLFAADILFIYGVAGMLLLAFASLRPAAILRWAGAILAAYTVAVVTLAIVSVEPAGSTPDPFTAGFQAFFDERAQTTVAAYTTGDIGAQLHARAWEALIIQGAQLFELPWVLALFLIGLAIGKSRVMADPASARPILRRIVVLSLPLGLAINVPIGFEGALGAVPAAATVQQSLVELVARPIVQALGPPLLGVGYLSGVALIALRHTGARTLRPLAAAGRMALSGYVAQSLLCTAFFVWLGFYDRLSSVEVLPVVVTVWAIVLIGCSAWLRTFERGPLETLWRRLTYGRA